MSDSTTNTLTVKGPKSLVLAFRDSVAGRNAAGDRSEFALGLAVPPPDGISMDDWRTWSAWALENWGSDREAGVVRVTDEVLDGGLHAITYVFTTAYFSAEVLVRSLITKHPRLDFDLRFVGLQLWSGHLTGSGGSVVESVEYGEPESHEESMERTGECLCSALTAYLPGCGDSAVDEARRDGTLSERGERLARQWAESWDGDFLALFEIVNDCEARGLNDEALDALGKLYPSWDGTFEELIEVVEAL
jgi:hypothetical protein